MKWFSAGFVKAYEWILMIWEKYGLKKAVFALFILCGLVVSIDYCQERNIEEFFRKRDADEIALTERRKANDNEIKLKLSRLLIESECSRVTIYEFHNGIVNPAGLGYAYSELTYEETDGKCLYMPQGVQKLTVSLYKWPNVLKNDRCCVNLTDDCAYDRRLKFDLEDSKVLRFGSIMLKGPEGDIGVLNVHYCDSATYLSKDDLEIKVLLYKYASDINALLKR